MEETIEVKENKTDNKIERGSTALALKAGFWYVVSNFLVKAISFITTPMFARLMTNTAYGEFSNYASWQLTLLIFTSLQIQDTLTRAYYDFTENYDEYVSTVLNITTIITGILYLIFIFFSGSILKVVSIPKEYVHIFFITILFMAHKQIYLSREKTMYRYKSVALISSFTLVVPTLIAILLVIFLPVEYRLSGRIYGYYIPSSLVGLFCGLMILKRSFKLNISMAKYAIKLSFPIMIHFLTAYLLNSSNVIVTKNILGPEVTAIVSVSMSIVNILMILFQSLSGSVMTWLMDNIKQNKKKLVRNSLVKYALIISIFTFLVILLSNELILVIGGKKYIDAASIVPGLLASALIQAISSIFMIILTYDKNVIKPALFTGVISVLSIILKVFFVRNCGYQVLPIINIIAFSLIAFVNYIIVINSGYKEYLDIRKIIIVVIPVVALSLVYPIISNNNILRYILSLLIIFIVIYLAIRNRKEIINVLRKKKS